ncbi:DUF2059 domain-containing protein [Breoghania sp. L-A4]|uniref:DUF2059 domain-containing protein n=1 Tax=Breoghania sp. L-A4 TaxID=2304600 RepID=UPI000E35A8CB|nr:DUF2059 domain-containing protein [Breoghania sp. L-A4]AXS40307.1 DUF2059 domain-containing protein [Breoghania sp. L-A4]
MKRVTMKRILAGVILAGCVATGPAAAAEDFTESHINAARAAIISSNSIRAYDEILPVIADKTRTLFIRSNPALTKEIDEVTNAVALDLVSKRAELDTTVMEIWAVRFSEEELKAIAAFYTSPVGAKLAELRPEMNALSIGAAKQWGDALSTVMVGRVRDELKKRGHNF